MTKGAVAKGFWDYANSPITIMIISTVMIGGFGRLYTNYKNELEKSRDSTKEFEDLISEIEFRKYQIESQAGFVIWDSITKKKNKDLVKELASKEDVFNIVMHECAVGDSVGGMLNPWGMILARQ